MSVYHKREFNLLPIHTLKRVDPPTTKLLIPPGSRLEGREMLLPGEVHCS